MRYSDMTVEEFASKMRAGYAAASQRFATGERDYITKVNGRVVMCSVNIVTGEAVRATWTDGTPVHIAFPRMPQ